ncbi:MAG: PH domain-containing protein [Prevotellaceae bacterium]|jgi:hypothetical protein|nr:PH domain-containing protein [Prevotellaceae bacterium]
MENDEKIIWEGGPSQWLNFNTFLICMLMAGVLVCVTMWHGLLWWVHVLFYYPFGKAIYAWFKLNSVKYKLTNYRFVRKDGVFNRSTKEFDLKELREVELIEPWYERIVKLGDIKLHFHSFSDLDIKLTGIPDPENVMKKFNQTLKEYDEFINSKNT